MLLRGLIEFTQNVRCPLLNDTSQHRLILRKFEEGLTHDHAFEIVLNVMGSKLLELKEPVLSMYSKRFVLDVLKFEAYFKSVHPQVFEARGVSLAQMVSQVYGDKTAISIRKLL